ncbi:MAG: recombination mediator RecR [Bdellovibrionota bacterium]
MGLMMQTINSSGSRPDPVARLVFELSKLPGIGEKTATRLAYFILKQDEGYISALSEALLNAKKTIKLCERCFTFTDIAACRICSDHSRNKNIICVVEKPSDAFSIEQTGFFRGVYHVLHGVISPLDGVGPDEIKIRELLDRLQSSGDGEKQEVIIATNPSVEGDTTAMYITKLLRPLGIKTTKLAHGLPAGGLLEYSDRLTIGKALENRTEVSG